MFLPDVIPYLEEKKRKIENGENANFKQARWRKLTHAGNNL